MSDTSGDAWVLYREGTRDFYVKTLADGPEVTRSVGKARLFNSVEAMHEWTVLSQWGYGKGFSIRPLTEFIV